MEFSVKKIILPTFFLFFILAIPEASAGVLSKPANNLGLVGYWSFNEGTTTVATDFSGNRNTGTLTNMDHPPTTNSGWTGGKLGSGLSCDGTNDHVTMGNQSSLELTGDLTISYWVYPTGAGSTGARPVVGKGASFNTSSPYISYLNKIDYFVSFVHNDGAAGQDSLQSTNNSTPLNQWTFVTLVRNTSGTTKSIYINGVLNAGPTSYTRTPTASGDPFVVCGELTDAEYVGAKVDEVRVYNRALSASEILNLYQSGVVKISSSPKSLITNGLAGYWTFDGGDTTDKVYDLSGQGNHGYFVGGATSSAKTIGKLGQALDFNGSSDYVTLGTGIPSSVLGTNPRTVSFWFNADSFDTDTADTIFRLSSGGGGNGSYLGFFAEDNAVSVGFSGHRIIFNKSGLSTNTWYHFVWTMPSGADSSQTAGYINGVEYVETTEAGSTQTINTSSGTEASIGSEPAANYYDGKIDEVRLYDRVLSNSEIKNLYNAGVGTKINHSQPNPPGTGLGTGLVGYWSFNGPDLTDRIYDRSGQGNDGYFVGATSSAKSIGKVGQGLTFGGSVYGLVYDSASLSIINSITISVWVKTTASENRLLDKRPSSENTYELAFAHCSIDTGFNVNSIHGQTLNDGVWHHYACTWDGSTIRTYIDGAGPYDPQSQTGSMSNTSDHLYIGAQHGGSTIMTGSLDELRIYARALSGAEIKQLYLLGK